MARAQPSDGARLKPSTRSIIARAAAALGMAYGAVVDAE
jgi:hypothetical protein